MDWFSSDEVAGLRDWFGELAVIEQIVKLGAARIVGVVCNP